MRVDLGGEPARGQLIDLRESPVDAGTVLAAIRDPSDDRVCAAPPTVLHDRVGFIHERVTIALGPALATAMRTRRTPTPFDRELATAERTRTEIEVPEVDLETPRSAVAAATVDTDALRERVARLGGRVRALRETNDPGLDAATADLEAAVSELAEAETEQVAAEQRLGRARQQAREARDHRERRLRLDDRIANLRREARAHLVATGWPAFHSAVSSMPVSVDVGEKSEAWTGPDWVAALGIGIVADLRAPIVVTGDGPTAVAGPELLGVPVIRV
jgi:hypothetical protein